MRRAPGPIGYTCPDIDDVISGIQDAEKALHGLVNRLENLREANETLRIWGSEKEEELEKCESDLNEANDKISELENEIKELKAEIVDLKIQL